MTSFRRSFALITTLSALTLGGCSQADHRPWSMAAPDPVTLRTTSLGPVVGGDGRYGNHAWLGIPFAAPPVGALRWRVPQPATPWKGTLQALKPASPCPQFASFLGGVSWVRPGHIAGAEDCLYLNITAPKFTPDQVPQGANRLPVLFWIHGGGNSMGTSAFYDGGHLSAAEHVIVVSTQYRLGPLGWFRHRALRSGSPDPAEQSGNFGTLDLIQALQWVRDNIAAFGGDPTNVTIFGESAGGTDVYTLLLSPKAKGLFSHAIVESGGLSRSSLTQAEAFHDATPPGQKNSSNEILLRLLERDGAKDRAAAKAKLAAMSDPQIAAYLRSKSAAELLAAYATNRRLGMIDMPLVFPDGVVLPAHHWLAHFADPNGWNRVPVILGTNHDEAKLFLAFDPRFIRRWFGFIPRFRDEPRFQAVAEYLSRTWKATGVDLPAEAMRQSGEPDVYAYRFDWHGEPTVAGADLSQMLGAAHGFEIPFVFGRFDLGRQADKLFSPQSAPDRAVLEQAMMSYWTEFASAGAPGRGRDGMLLPWTAWDNSAPDKPKFIVLNTPSEGGLSMSSQTESRPRIVADLIADTRLPTALDKCRMFHELAGRMHGIRRRDYPHIDHNECANYPFKQFPWGK